MNSNMDRTTPITLPNKRPMRLSARLNSRQQQSAVKSSPFVNYKRGSQLVAIGDKASLSTDTTTSPLTSMQTLTLGTESNGKVIENQRRVLKPFPETTMQPSTTSQIIGRVIQNQQQSGDITPPRPRRSLDFMELRDGKRLNTTPGRSESAKVALKRTPLVPVVSVPSPRPSRRASVEDLVVQQQDQGLLSSPFEDDGRQWEPSEGIPPRRLFAAMGSSPFTPGEGMGSADSSPPSATGLEPGERRAIRRIARLASQYGFEWDNLAVALIALVKLVSMPFVFAFRILFRVWTVVANGLDMLGGPGILLTLFLVVSIALYSGHHDIGLETADIMEHVAEQPTHEELLMKRIMTLESSLETLTDLVDTVVKKPSSDEARNELDQRMMEMDRRLSQVLQRIEDEVSVRLANDASNELKTAKHKIETMSDRLHTLATDVEKIAKRTENAPDVDFDRLVERILEKVDKNEYEKLASAVESRPDLDHDKVMQIVRQELQDVQQKMEEKINGFAHQKYSSEGALEAEMVHHMIDSALEKFAADTIAVPDYALRSAGARILRYNGLTSKIYMDPYGQRHQARFTLPASGLIGWIQDMVMPSMRYPMPPPMANPPEAVIDGTNRAGRCWSFSGSSGVLTILLAKRIIPTNITIEHVPRSNWPDARCAPKSMEFSGTQLSNEADDMLSSTYRRIVNDQGFLRSVYGSFYGESSSDVPIRVGEASTTHDLSPHAWSLGAAQYNVEGKPMQTFPVREQKGPIDVFQIRVKSNWGHPDYTCLYRVRVHGIEVYH